MVFYTSYLQTTKLDCTLPEDQLMDQRYKLGEGSQTSAKYLSKIAQLDACLDKSDVQKQKIHALIKDLEIKSNSYAWLNKIFFWLSLVFALCIISFPILNSLVAADSKWAKIFNPTQLPAITLLAGLCFTFYSDYKGKQTSTENLIRYAYTSQHPINLISKTVRDGLAQIDSGHDFSKLIESEE